MGRTTDIIIDESNRSMEELNNSIRWLVEQKPNRDVKGYDVKYAIFQTKVIGRIKSYSDKEIKYAVEIIGACPDKEIRDLLIDAASKADIFNVV